MWIVFVQDLFLTFIYLFMRYVRSTACPYGPVFHVTVSTEDKYLRLNR